MLAALFLGALLPALPVSAAAPRAATRGVPLQVRPARHTPPPLATPSTSSSPRAFAPRASSLPAGVGVNVQVSPADNNLYTTTAVAQDPSNPGGLYVSPNITSKGIVGGFWTSDGGSSWQAQPLPQAPNPPNTYAYYPAPAFDADGYLYETEMPYASVATTNYITTQLNVFRSSDRGAHWTGPYQVESDLNGAEKPLMAADTSSSAFRNRLYVAYDTNPAQGSEPMLVARSDDGINWQRTTVFDSGGDFGGYPAVGPNGEVYVAWDDFCGGISASTGTCSRPLGRILVAKSTDGGATFTALGTSPTAIADTQIGFGTTIPNWSNTCGGAGPAKVSPTPSIAVDRSGGAHNGWVYAVWADPKPPAGPGQALHIQFSRSTDGGAHWSTPTQLDAGNARDAWQPAIAIDQSNGLLTMAWYQRDDPKLYRTFYTQSRDGGDTFLPAAVPVADSLSDATLQCTGTGSYMEMSAAGGIAHPVWVDTRNGRAQIFTAAITENLVTPATPPAARLGALTDYPAGANPFAPVVADFNGDGKADIAVVMSDAAFGAGVSVLPGNGDGTFGPAIFSPTSRAGTALATADFNGDGKPDLVVTNKYTNSLSVLMGKGDGTFQPPVDYALAANPGNVVVADVNGDGKPDLVVIAGSSVSILLNKGDGTFKAPWVSPALPTGQSSALQVADFNGDGKPDVAVAINSVTADYTRVVTILLGNGDGTLQPLDPANTFSAGGDSRVQGLAAVDLNGDGKPDIAVTTLAGSQNLGVLINTTTTGGPLSFRATATYTAPAGFVGVGDFNGDGRKDVAITAGTNTLAVLLSNADGTLQPEITTAASTYPTGFATGDFNRDGKLDVVIAAQSPGGLTVGLGLGDGHFLAARTIAVGWSPYFVAAADLNGDGKPDILVGNNAGAGTNTTPSVTGLLGNGDGTFKPGVTTAMQGTVMAVGDLNGDHWADVVLATTSSVQVMMGKGDGSFAAPTATYAINGRVNAIALGDFNGDGKVDLAVSGMASIPNGYAGALWIFTGNGDGTFAPTPVAIQLNSYSGGGMVTGDFNHDGKLDLVMSVGSPTVGPNGVDVFLNTTSAPGAAPTFAAPVLYGNSSGTVASGDLNRDGNLDLTVAGSNGFFVFLGKPDGTFQPAISGGPGGADAVGDINGDGIPDVVYGDSASSVAVRLGYGNGLFGPPTSYEVDQGPHSLALADFNGDGNLDFVVANGNGNDVSVVLGVEPVAQLGTSSVAFGPQAVGTTSAPATVTLTNQGPADLFVSSAAVQGNNPSDFSKTADTCSAHSLAATQSCSVTLTFTPASPTSRDAVLRFTDSGRGGLQSVALSGSGTGPGATFSPASLLFDEQLDHSSSQPRSLTVTNNGTASLVISTLALSGSAAGEFAKSADTCSGATVAVGSSCSVSYTFAAAAAGHRSAMLTIADSAYPGNQRIALAGISTQSLRATASRQQYALTGSDGATWETIDNDLLSLHVTPTATSFAIVNANADLWTANARYNQDLGILVWGGVYPTVAGRPEAWKESGGFAGTYSPNAAAVQAVVPLVAGTTYVFQVAAKANIPDPGSILIGAGPWPAGSPDFSPTRLSVHLVAGSASVFSAMNADQHFLANSDGTTWHDVDSTSATPLALAVTPPAGSNWVALLSANIDLWTARAGYNQDVGIKVAEADPNVYPGNIVAWKESGGFAGTFSPNAAFVQGVLPMAGGSTYHVTLEWKTNKPTFNNGATIYAAAGGAGAYSPSRLTVLLVPAASLSKAVSSAQFALNGSDGTSWVDMSSGGSAPLTTVVTPASSCLAIISGNVDLWTAQAGFNQDVGISVAPAGGSAAIAAWKESGGFAGTYSPNAAFVQAVVPLAGGIAYTVKLVWKANRADPSVIVGGAGPWPAGGGYSPSVLTVLLTDCS